MIQGSSLPIIHMMRLSFHYCLVDVNIWWVSGECRVNLSKRSINLQTVMHLCVCQPLYLKDMSKMNNRLIKFHVTSPSSRQLAADVTSLRCIMLLCIHTRVRERFLARYLSSIATWKGWPSSLHRVYPTENCPFQASHQLYHFHFLNAWSYPKRTKWCNCH